MPKRQRQRAAGLSETWCFRIFATMLVAAPLVFDGDLLRFTLLPKRLAVQIGLLLLLLLLTRDALNIDRPSIPRSILNLPTLAYALVTATALLWAGNVVAAIESVSHLLTYVLLFFAAVTVVRREQTPNWLKRSVGSVSSYRSSDLASSGESTSAASHRTGGRARRSAIETWPPLIL